jgi:hypothetical protein
MRANIITETNTYEAEITRDHNKLIITFNNEHNVVPYPVISKCKFDVIIKPTEEEIGCGSCNTCLTPLC